jgi:hypothetical protein
VKTPAAQRKKRSVPAPVGKRPAVVHGVMRGHLGLSTAVGAYGVNPSEAAELVAALRPYVNMRKLMPSQQFDIVFDPGTGQVARFTYHLSSTVRVIAERDDRGRLSARREPPEPKTSARPASR